MARFTIDHRWPTSRADAVALQEQLRVGVVIHDELGWVATVAGVDVGFEQEGTISRAAVAVLSYPQLALVDHAVIRLPTTFPYVPGLLAFREVPAIVEALNQLAATPDLLLCDGQGYAHPRRFGLACHLGVVTGLPCIGVAKSRLVGIHQEVDDQRGAWQPLLDEGQVIGAALRTRSHVKPVYVSVGNRISLVTALAMVLICSPRYRLPETTRWAHRLASG